MNNKPLTLIWQKKWLTEYNINFCFAILLQFQRMEQNWPVKEASTFDY